MNEASLGTITRRIRHDILTMTTTAGSGHPTSSLSAVELMTVLFFKYLRYDLDNPKNPANDRVIFSKGHASPLYYALYAAAGAISQEELAKYRTFDSVLEGHPTPRFRYTEASTGSLGQGLSIGLGEALALRLASDSGDQHIKHDHLPRVFVLSGDGELAEGSVWEAAAAASYHKVDNLFFIVDVNRLGQSGPTMYETDISIYRKRFEAFGCRVVVIENGNNLDAVSMGFDATFKGSAFKGIPTIILAKTKKGAGISFLEDKDGWHGKPLVNEDLEKALEELGDVDLNAVGVVHKPKQLNNESTIMNREENKIGKDHHSVFTIQYSSENLVATRKAFGNALKRLGVAYPEIVVIDGDVKNSTYTDAFGKELLKRFVELFIAEQNMAGVAVGFSARGFHPVVSSFAAFLSRATDQFRMAALSGANILVNGSHAGVSIGEDGPSQMGLEDLAIFRSMHGTTVLYPSDAISTERLTELALSQKGITYIRTTRSATPILYDTKEQFDIGGSHVFTMNDKRQTMNESVTIIAAGITLHEALRAQKELADEGVSVCVIDCYSVKPIDEKTILKAAKDSKAMIVVEDHYPEGGLGEAVKSALSASDSGLSARVLPGGTTAEDQYIKIHHLAVRKTPRSGSSAELLAYEEIDAIHIIQAVKSVIS